MTTRIEEVSDASLGKLLFLVFLSLVVCLTMSIQGLKSKSLQLKGISPRKRKNNFLGQNWQTALCSHHKHGVRREERNKSTGSPLCAHTEPKQRT